MPRLLMYLFYRNSRLLLLIGAIIVTLGLMLGLLGTKQINFSNYEPADCLNFNDCTMVYIADWDKDLVVLGETHSATYFIINPSRFSPPLDRAIFKTNASIIVTMMTIRDYNTDLGFTLRDHNGDSSRTGSIVEQIIWQDAGGFDRTSTTDLYQSDPSGFRVFQYDWSAGLPFYYVVLLMCFGYVFLLILEAKKVIPSRPTRKRTSSSSGRTRPEDA